MPYKGEVDLTDILASLGDHTHGLRAGLVANTEVNEDDYIYQATYRGPVDFSTSREVAPVYVHVWDVNHYYRDLGIEWPYKVTKWDLKRAYERLDGQNCANSRRLTYVLKQLLNPEIRAAYDAMPLGKRFDDLYVQQENRRILSDIARQETEESGKIVTVGDLTREIDERNQWDLPPVTVAGEWSYYLLNSRKYDPTNLWAWQEYLVRALADRGVKRKISMGYVGKTKRQFLVKQHQDHVIFFLNDTIEPTLELALEATASKRKHSRTRKKNR